MNLAGLPTCCTFTLFALVALTMLYGYCIIGDQLTQQVL